MPPRTSPPRKRQRVSLACTNCRQRKSRCDGHRPDCSPCQELHVQCVYESLPESDKQVSRETLLRKVAKLEAQLKARIPENAESMVQISEASPSSSAISSSSRRARRHAAVAESDDIGVDTLASGAFDDTPASNIGFFGSSSNFALFRNLSHSFSHLARQSRSTASSRARVSIEYDEPEQALPDRHEGDVSQATLLPDEKELLFLLKECYHNIGFINPCIDLAALLEFWKGHAKDKTQVIRRSSYALVNIMLAHGSAVLGRHNTFLFYHRCCHLLDMQTLQGADIETVQSFLLLSIFQQNHQRSIESWTTHTLAVKAALQLGLHSPSYYYEDGTESETHKRLWFCIINQDRLLAILLGRPFLIAPQYIRVSIPEAPIAIPTALVVPSYAGSLLDHGHLFRNIIGIHAIQSAAVERLYDYNIDGPSRRSPREIMTTRLDLTMQLDEWSESLHQTMQILQPNDPRGEARVSAASRWSIILSVHYYLTKLLINAPVLKLALAEGQKLWLSNFPFSMIRKSAEEVLVADFKSAKELQYIVQETHGARIWDFGKNPIWFICNYSMFTVSLHAFGILLYIKGLGNATAVEGVPAKKVRLLLDNSLESMRLVGRPSLMSQKARECLLRFLNFFDSMTHDEEVCTNVESNILGIDMRNVRSQDPAEPDFDFSQFITDTAEEFLFQL